MMRKKPTIKSPTHGYMPAKLSCNCDSAVKVGADRNDPVYCLFHGWSVIKECYPSVWRIRCLHCNYSRWIGQSETYARRKAKLHGSNYSPPHDKILVEYDEVTRDGQGKKLKGKTADVAKRYYSARPEPTDQLELPPF